MKTIACQVFHDTIAIDGFSIVFPNFKDYCLPGTDFTVRKNDMILFPNEAVHRFQYVSFWVIGIKFKKGVFRN